MPSNPLSKLPIIGPRKKNSFFEASVNYVQEHLLPGRNTQALEEIANFQSRPERPPARLDGYKTKHAYGAWLYLKFLEQRYFGGKADFILKVWDRLANKSPDQTGGVWIAAIQSQLPIGTTYADTVIEFARWRTFLEPASRRAAQQISKKSTHGKPLPSPSNQYHLRVLKQTRGVKSKGMPVFGTHYIELVPHRNCSNIEIQLNGSSMTASTPKYLWAMKNVTLSNGHVLMILTALPSKDEDPLAEDLHDYEFTAACK